MPHLPKEGGEEKKQLSPKRFTIQRQHLFSWYSTMNTGQDLDLILQVTLKVREKFS